MSQELLYTSAPHGLKPGSRGFCTVLSTQGMAAPLASALEGLSGYRPVFPPGDEQHDLNPITWSHVTLPVAGRTCHILSRISEYGLDYSQRTNKLAHHVVLDSGELITAGPAALLRNAGFMRDEWNEEPHLTPTKPVPPIPPRPPGVCQAWKDLTGDGGWAGVLAESFLRDAERPIILLYAPGQDMLPLIAEAISLIPANRRWEVTFTTYFTGLPQTVNCNWRCMLHDSPEAHQSLRFVRALRFDLTNPENLGIASGNELVADARGMPRLKTWTQGLQPPLPTTDGAEESNNQTSINTDDQIPSDDLPPLPGGDTYQVRQNKTLSPSRQSKKRLPADTANTDFERKRKIAALIGGSSLFLLLLIGLITGIVRFTRVHPKVSPTLGAQSKSPEFPTTEAEPAKKPTEEPTSVAVSQSTPTDNIDNEKAVPSRKPNLPEIENLSDPKPSVNTQDPIKSKEPAAEAIPDDLAPSSIQVSIDTRRKRRQELLSLFTRENPFLSITLFSAESLPLSGLSKTSNSELLLEIQPKGSLSDITFTKVSSIKSTSQIVGERSKYTLIADIIGNDQSNLERLQWCELAVLNRNPPQKITLIKFHQFPLKDTVLRAKFSNVKDVCRASWDLKIPTENTIPKLQMANLSVTFGPIEYKFVLDPQPGKLSEEVIAKFHSLELKSAISKVLQDVDEVKIASASAILVRKSNRPSTTTSLESHEVTLELGGKAKLGNAFSITSSGKASVKSVAKSSIDDVIQCLHLLDRKTDVKGEITEFNKEKDPSKLSLVVDKFIMRLNLESNALALLTPSNDKHKLQIDAARASVETALKRLDELKKRCEAVARLERDLEQAEVKSTDLHYVIVPTQGESRNVFVFNTTDK